MTTGEKPLVSVILAARPQRVGLARAVQSIVANRTLHAFEIWIVRLGGGEDSDAPLGSLLDDPRVHSFSTASVESARAHNEVIPYTRGEILAFTDHDCEVSSDWIATLAAAFERDARIGLVFGSVHRADPAAVTSPSYVVGEERMARDLRDKADVEGVWACMAMRRRVWIAIGGFDEQFGAGASFPGGADGDVVMRALGVGEWVLETPRPVVQHHRRLSGEAHRDAVIGYSYASGALLAKHLRLRPRAVASLTVTLARRWLRGTSHSALALSPEAPRRWARLAATLRGFCHGATTPVDRRTGRFCSIRQEEPRL